MIKFVLRSIFWISLVFSVLSTHQGVPNPLWNARAEGIDVLQTAVTHQSEALTYACIDDLKRCERNITFLSTAKETLLYSVQFLFDSLDNATDINAS